MSDLIDRQEAIDEIKKDIMGGLNFEGIINRMPTIDAVPVRNGRWKFEYSLNMNYCSECGWGMVKGERRKYNYCPNCGAKMDGEERTDEA